MKRSVSILFFSYIFIGAGCWKLPTGANAFAPIGSTQRKSYHPRHVTGSFQENVMRTRSTELIPLHSSSSENSETVSSNDIIGPALPPIEGSAKRLFLVRHGEVINPGE